MKLLVPRQTEVSETRVSLTPAAVKKVSALGVEVLVEAGAGKGAHHADAAYESAAAQILSDASDAGWGTADVVVTIRPPTADQLSAMRRGAVLIGMLDPFREFETVTAAAGKGLTSFSMELLPRISRAQPMDVLSSQANIGGYLAAVVAAASCPKMFPMMITAAGTIAPSRVLVVGAGVAGLQAIATAKRLGAVVEAYDIRPEVEEQIQSLGARFVKLPATQNDASTQGGYARQQTDEERKQQAQLMAKHVISADAVITTAAVFGKAPPMLIPADVVAQKEPGSVIVDLAADPITKRGNCELTEPDTRITTPGGVVIEGPTNLPARVPVHSSHVYANNMVAFLELLIEDGSLKLDLEDEVQRGPLLTHEGDVAHELVKKVLAEKAPTPATWQ